MGKVHEDGRIAEVGEVKLLDGWGRSVALGGWSVDEGKE